MSVSEVDNQPLMSARCSANIAAPPEDVYRTVSDLSRCGEWSPECRGGNWVSGTPAAPGSVFEGLNERHDDVVAWAPVVRGSWTTRSEVLAAEPGRNFRWAMQDSAGRAQRSVWAFEIEPDGTGSVLHHTFRMDAATEGITGITADMDAEERQRFFRDWGAKIEADLAHTLQRIKHVLEA